MNTSKKVRFLALGALIAALYAVLTYVAAAVNLAYGPVQFRFSEALTVLPVFTPAAIPGLTLGCTRGPLAWGTSPGLLLEPLPYLWALGSWWCATCWVCP